MSFPLVPVYCMSAPPPLLSTLTDLIVNLRKKKTVPSSTESGCTGRWTGWNQRWLHGKLCWGITYCVCVCVCTLLWMISVLLLCTYLSSLPINTCMLFKESHTNTHNLRFFSFLWRDEDGPWLQVIYFLNAVLRTYFFIMTLGICPC